jgi:hypothetical protein
MAHVRLQILISYPKLLGDSTVSILSRRNLQRRVVEVFETFWFKRDGLLPLREFLIQLIRKPFFHGNDSIFRNFLTRVLPWDPLQGSHGPIIDVYCLVAKKDLELLRFTLPSLLNLSRNPVRDFIIVAPQSLATQIEAVCQSLDLGFRLISDERLLEEFALDSHEFIYGHPKMLMLKYLCALRSDLDNVLVVDGDTVYLKPRQWLTEDSKLIVVSQELHKFHLEYCAYFFDIKPKNNLGHTTQSQLLSKEDIKGISEHIGGLKELAKNFSSVYEGFHTGVDERFFPAEWQLACGWSHHFNLRKSVFGSYSNFSFEREIFLKFMEKNHFPELSEDSRIFLQSLVPHLGSISLHDYK